jgi:hypothetical protein
MPEGFSYDLEHGFRIEEDNMFEQAMNTYGFWPDALIPGLAQYQTLQGGFDHRRIVGTTAQVGLAMYSMNNLVLWCNKYSNPGQGLVSGMAAKRSALLGTAIPKSPFGMMFRSMAAVSWAIVFYDVSHYALNYGFLGESKQSFVDGLVEFATMGMFS